MINFPNAPTLGQVFGDYTWDGEKWKQNSGTSAAAGSITPLPDTGAGWRGTAVPYSREDHVHPIGAAVVPSDAAPLMNGSASPGSLAFYSRADHVHPGDTLRATVAYVDAQDSLKAPLVSPAFTGTPTVPTAPPSTNTTQIASTAFVVAAVGTAAGISPAVIPLGGRLTFAVGASVMGSNVAGGNTIYYVPHNAGYVPVYDGTSWSLADIGAGISQLTSDATKSPGACAPNMIYDLFVWNDAGVIRLSRGPVWTNAVTRGLALARQNGLSVNAAAITNGPLAARGTWVGTFIADASALATWVRGSNGAAGAGKATLNLWNAYNRVGVNTVVGDTTLSWTYNAATWRPANNQTGNRVGFVLGDSSDDVEFEYVVIATTAAPNIFPWAGVGIDGTAAHSGTVMPSPTTGDGTTVFGLAVGKYCGKLGMGSHFAQALEASTGTSFVTFYGALVAGKQMMGLSANLKM
jgi:hypothetical protein